MFEGYWGRPEATVEAYRNLWFHTGDIGRIDDDDFLFFVDRKADYLRRRGENISSFDVERILMGHGGLADVVVHAVPSEMGEDDLKITATLAQVGQGASASTEADLFRFCIDALPYFALPRYIEFRAELPRSPVGRVLKRVLRDEGRTATTWCRRRLRDHLREALSTACRQERQTMNLDDMIMISVDDHVVEPPHLFDGRLPAKYADLAPKVVTTPEGDDVWTYNGTIIPNVGLNAVAGRPKQEYGIEPTSFSEMRPGCYDIHERVKDMSAGGVLAAMCFPSFPSFSGRLFLADQDHDLSSAVVRAYNDWHIDEWCGTYPERHIPMIIPMLWDPVASAAEVRRVSAKGCHSLTFTENPAALGLPSFHTDYWDPMWQALVETETVLNIHLGSSGKLAVTAPDAPMDVMITLQPMNICMAAADLVWSRVFKQFPTLKVALSEGGTGWIPYFLDRLDRTYDMHHLWTGQDFDGLRCRARYSAATS